MEKKKWHRSPGIKGLLLLFQYIFLGAVIFSGLFLITSLAHGLRLSDSGKDYLDSTAFANTLYDAAYDVMYGISVTFPYTCLLYTSPSPRDPKTSRMPSSA